MGEENAKMEDTIWDHSVSDLSYDRESFNKEVNVVSNITHKNLHTLKNIERDIAILNSLKHKSDLIPNVEKSTLYHKEREYYQQKLHLQSSIVNQLCLQEKAIKKNIETIKNQLQIVETELARHNTEKKKLHKSYKAAEIVLEKINDHYKSNFGIRIDFVEEECGICTFLLRFHENECRPLKLAFNSSTNEISLIEVAGLNDEQMDQVRKFLHNKYEAAGVFCILRDLYIGNK